MAGHSRQHDCVLLDDRWQVFLVDALASGSGDRWHVVFVSALASSCGDRWQVSLATIHSLYAYSNELCEVSAKDEINAEEVLGGDSGSLQPAPQALLR